MCDTAKCAACRPARKVSMTGQLLLGLIDVIWWLAKRAAKALAPAAVALAWAAYVWLTGRTWRHQVRRRLVRREVRATANWLVTVAAAGLVWQPVATGIALAVVGGSLVTTALAWRHREQLAALTGRRQIDRGPIRVRAKVGTPTRRLASREEVPPW